MADFLLVISRILRCAILRVFWRWRACARWRRGSAGRPRRSRLWRHLASAMTSSAQRRDLSSLGWKCSSTSISYSPDCFLCSENRWQCRRLCLWSLAILRLKAKEVTSLRLNLALPNFNLNLGHSRLTWFLKRRKKVFVWDSILSLK